MYHEITPTVFLSRCTPAVGLGLGRRFNRGLIFGFSLSVCRFCRRFASSLLEPCGMFDLVLQRAMKRSMVRRSTTVAFKIRICIFILNQVGTGRFCFGLGRFRLGLRTVFLGCVRVYLKSGIKFAVVQKIDRFFQSLRVLIAFTCE